MMGTTGNPVARTLTQGMAVLALLGATRTAAAEDDPVPPDPELDAFMDPHAGRGRGNVESADVEWWEERAWRWEVGAGGGLRWRGAPHNPLALHAAADGRFGVRYQRRPSQWDAGFGRAVVGGLSDAFLGHQYGADVRVHWFAKDAWAAGLKPTAAI